MTEELNCSCTRRGDPGIKVIEIQVTRLFLHTQGWSWVFRWWWLYKRIVPAHAGVIPISTDTPWPPLYCSCTRRGDPFFHSVPLMSVALFLHTQGWSQNPIKLFVNLDIVPAHAGVILMLYPKRNWHLYCSCTRRGDPVSYGSKQRYWRLFLHTQGWS